MKKNYISVPLIFIFIGFLFCSSQKAEGMEDNSPEKQNPEKQLTKETTIQPPLSSFGAEKMEEDSPEKKDPEKQLTKGTVQLSLPSLPSVPYFPIPRHSRPLSVKESARNTREDSSKSSSARSSGSISIDSSSPGKERRRSNSEGKVKTSKNSVSQSSSPVSSMSYSPLSHEIDNRGYFQSPRKEKKQGHISVSPKGESILSTVSSSSSDIFQLSEKIQEKKEYLPINVSPVSKTGFGKLMVLDVSEQHLNTPDFSSNLSDTKTLTTLNMHLGYSSAYEKPLNDLLKVLAYHPTIKTIDLSSSYLHGFGDAIAQVLINNTTLTQFNLGSCNLIQSDAPQIFNALSENRGLKTFIIRSNALGEKACQPIVNVLTKNTMLTALDLYGTQIHLGNFNDGGIAKALTQDLVFVNLSGSSSSLCCKNIYQPQYLQDLNLGANYIGNEEASGIAPVISSNTVLTTLNLSKNNISGQGIQSIAEALPNNISLTSLDLERNKIGKEGADLLAFYLPKNKGLKILNLGENQMADEGVQQIFKSLKDMKLTTLYLHGNQITGASVPSIKKSLEKYACLTTLDLRGNKLEANDALNIFDTLKKNSTLTMLNLGIFSITIGQSQYTIKISGENEISGTFGFGKKVHDDMREFIRNSLDSDKKIKLVRLSDSDHSSSKK